MSNLSTLPKGDSAWLLRKAIERIIDQVSVLETNIGVSTSGNSANTQIIFNDAGTLRGDPDLIFNTALNKLVALNLESTAALVVGTSATITGDLTVDTSTLKVDSANNRVGIGTASPQYPLDVRGGNISCGNGTIFGGISYSTRASIGSFSNHDLDLITNGVAQYVVTTAGNHTWFNGGTTAMTLNSTGLGIGGSPTRKLSIVGSGATYANINSGDNTSLVGILLGGTSTPSAGQLIYDNTANSLALFTSGASRLLIDTSGNVGIGVTPSAWSASFKSAQVGSRLVLTTTGSDTFFGNNFYNDGAYKFINADYATYYDQTTGKHVWGTSTTSGAANGVITWNAAMTLDASGNLMVGTTSAGGNRLNVQTASGDCTTLIKSQAANVNSAIDYVTNYGNHTIRKSGAAVWDFGVINDSSATPAFKVSNASSIGVQLVSAATSWTALSDETMKDIIEPISNAVSKVGSLRSVIGKFKTDDSNKRRSFLIAQDVQSVLPEAVDVIGENNELGLRYTEVIPLLVAAIKELTAEVNALKKA